ncbi:MAG: hypothetical protein FJZ16_01155 [Candidatus Omnitrophica bacterium]|nr:hypothetical protein [Candidatus Omnitrophota bacterium]
MLMSPNRVKRKIDNMIKYLSDDEALKVAINLEKDGIDFYTKVASSTVDFKTRDVFLGLLEDEKEHYKLFKDLHDSLKDSFLRIPDVDEEVSDYLRALVSTRIFDIEKITKSFLKKLSVINAILIGIQAEKESILFYTEAAKNSENPKGRKAFTTILREEKKHLIRLNQRLRYLKRS